MRHKDVSAGFEYFAQPCSLTARLVPKRTRINVEPECLLLVDGDRVRLDAKLKYTVRGAKTFALDVALPGWQVDDVGPDNLVAVDGLSSGGSNLYSIPLLQPSAGQFEIRIRAHQAIAADAKSLAISLPQPLGGAPQAGIVVVLPADNVELIPDAKAILGLVRQQIAAPLDLPARQQTPLVYRGEPGKDVFAADIRRHAQRIRVEEITRLDVDEQGGQVEEKLSYAIAYAPVDRLLLDVPRSLAGANRLELFAQDRPVAAVALPDSGDDPARPVRMRVALPQASIGLCRLTARYRAPLEKPVAAKRTVLSVPLILPAEGELSGEKLIVHTAAGLRAEVGRAVDGRRRGRREAARRAQHRIDRREAVAARRSRRAVGRRGGGDRRAGVGADLVDRLRPPGPRRLPVRQRPQSVGSVAPRRRRPRADRRAAGRQADGGGHRRGRLDDSLGRRRRARPPSARTWLSIRRSARPRRDVLGIAAAGAKRLGPPHVLAAYPAAERAPVDLAEQFCR